MPYAVIRHSVSSTYKPKDEEIDIIDVSDDHLEHRLNNHPGKSEQALYRFDRVERGTGGNEGRWLIFVKNPNTGDEEYVWVDESQIGKTVITHDSLKRVLSRVFYGVGIRMNDDELSKVAYTIQRLHPQVFAQKPSGNISKTTPKKNSTVNPPQHLKHSLFTEVYDMDDYLEHGVTVQQIRRSYVYQKAEMNYNGYNMGSRKVPYVKVWFRTTEKPMYKELTPDPYYAIIGVEHIPLNGNRAAAIKTELKGYFDQFDQLISDSELNKATYGALEAVNPIMNDRAADATHRPQHAGYYSPNLRVRHALFTEVYDMDDYLEHHGILGMKWGVRRYQNADGSLTAAGAKRYGVKGDRKGTQNRLNDLDKAIARNKRHVAETAGEIKGYEKKINKYANSHSSNADLKKDKYEAKADEARLKKAEYEKNIETGKKEIESLLKEAVANGYTVQRIEAMRNTNEGRDALAAILASVAGIGIPSLLGAPIGMFFVPSNMEKGTKYKVKETKEGEEAKVVDKKGHYATTGVPRSINQAVEDGLKERERRQQSSTNSSNNQNNSRGMVAMVPAGTLPESTRITGKEEEEFWKELAKYYEKQGNRG